MKKPLKFVGGLCTIAVGEGAGKRHQVIEAPGVSVYEENNCVYVKTEDCPATVTHPEHAQITIPANEEMQIVIQEEYNDFGEYRKVMD